MRKSLHCFIPPIGVSESEPKVDNVEIVKSNVTNKYIAIVEPVVVRLFVLVEVHLFEYFVDDYW